MGKKSKKQRKAERASKVVREPTAQGFRPVFRPGLGFGGVFVSSSLDAGDILGGECSIWAEVLDASSARESTLPAAITDLLKVEAPKRYSTIPPHANHCKAEDRFEYLKGLRAGEPVAMRCPDCDVRLGFAQSRGTMFSRAFGGESFNRCRYCGVTYTFHGSRLVWWR